MKKTLFGCLGILVIGTIVSAVAGYYFVYLPGRSFVAGLTQLQELPKLNARIRNTSPFTAPPDGVLTEAMVTRYVKAQQALHDTLGARLQALDAKFEVLNREDRSETSFSDGIAALRDLGSVILDAKRVQVDVLNAHGFSLAEYDWVRNSMYAASGVPMSLDFSHFIDQASKGQVSRRHDMAEAVTREVPERNRELVAPHEEMLEQNAALAFFGL